MAPLQVILLLMLVRLPAILRSSSDVLPATGTGTASGINFSAWWVVGSWLISLLFVVIIVMQRARAGISLLHLPTINASAVSARLDHLFGLARWATLVITAIHLYGLGLSAIVNGWLETTLVLKHIPLMAEAIYIFPAFLAWLGIWTANYELEAAIRERSFPYRLASGLPTHEMPSLGHYLSMQVRHNYYLVILVAVTGAVEGAGEWLDPYLPHAEIWAMAVAPITVLLMVPWLITHLWSTVPLRGPLRRRLDRLAGEYRLRFRDIKIWKTHNHVTNAAILGWVPFARYFLMTDALLETLTDQQIEAVFAHEVGHGVHRHILWYLALMVGALVLCTGFANITAHALPESWMTVWIRYMGDRDAFNAIIMMGMLMLFMAIGFSFVSHRFEHQADWFAAKHMAKLIASNPASLPIAAKALTVTPDPLDVIPSIMEPALKGEPTRLEGMTLEYYASGKHVELREAGGVEGAGAGIIPGIEGKLLSPAEAGAEMFISSLDTIVELAHRSRAKRGWMHPSVNNRMALLRNLAVNPAAVAAFQRRMLTTRLLIVLLVAIGSALLYLSSRLPQSPPPNPHQMEVDHSGKSFLM